jgi:hypothetical protein
VRSAITHINDIGGILALGSSTSSIRLYSPVEPWYTISSITSANIGYYGVVTPTGLGMPNAVETSTPNQYFGTGIWLISVQFELGSGTMNPVYQYNFRIKRDGTIIFRIARSGDRIDLSLDNILECATAVFTGPCNITLTAFVNCGFSTLVFYPYYHFVRIA